MSKPVNPRPITWAVGVITVPERKDDLLVQTLHSLCDAGFGDPHLFVDGCDDPSEYKVFGGLVSCRPNPPVNIVGNWVMGMWELYVRNPQANYYASFEDDITVVLNLREYLENCEYPKRGYWNLILHKENEKYVGQSTGWHKALQRGLGACGLVFDREALGQVLGAANMIRMPCTAKRKTNLDGAISQVLKDVGWKEYVHRPSLVQHWGTKSILKNRNYPPLENFPGEDFDATTWLDGSEGE